MAGTYANPYTWTDQAGDEHTLETHCTQQETQAECEERHDEAVEDALDEWPAGS